MRAIFSNDDAGASSNPHSITWFGTAVDWLNGLGIPGTFFWVPKPREFEKCHALWHDALFAARDTGHDFQLHGLTHGTCLEFGIPQPSTRRANSQPFEECTARREFWEAEHSVASLTAKLNEGQELFVRTFGTPAAVFRAPCFGVCPAMYEALAAVGIRCSSSRGINPTATAYTLLRDPALRRWEPDFPCRPWTEPPGVIEIACVEDLCIGGVAPEDAEDRLDLYLSELSHIAAAAGDDGVIVLGTHYTSMAKTWDRTRPLLEAVISWLNRHGVDEWVTFSDYISSSPATVD